MLLSSSWAVRLIGLGGTVVHIVSATTSAVYSGFCSWKRPIFRKDSLTPGNKTALNETTRHQNPANILLGTLLLWIGWFGFNGGSALGANLRAASACISTHIAACAGGAMGTLIDYWIIYGQYKLLVGRLAEGTLPEERYKARFSITGFCNGAIAGLVAITPAAGYVRHFLSRFSKEKQKLISCNPGSGMVSSHIRSIRDRVRCFCYSCLKSNREEVQLLSFRLS